MGAGLGARHLLQRAVPTPGREGMRPFDSLLCLDYSASSVPTRGKDSLWVAGWIMGRDVLTNFSTRAVLHAWLDETLHDHIKAGKRLLAGFDFAFGYPRGFAAALGLSGVAWAATWKHLAALIEDGPRNQNNRFRVADDLNRRLGLRAVFWGRPAHLDLPYLPARKTVTYDQGLSEWRAFEAQGRTAADRRIGRMQSGWKLAYTGSVGSQALMGIARLQQHRQVFGDRLAIWPFEAADRPLVFAEIYPSMFDSDQESHKVKDARQVLAAASALARADLDVWLDRTPLADDPNILTEEGWLLGWSRGAASNGIAH